LRGGRAVKIKVTRDGWIGRYLLLTARRRNGRLGLGYKTSGCLSPTGAKIRCPHDATPRPLPPIIIVVPVPVPPPPPPTPNGPTAGSSYIGLQCSPISTLNGDQVQACVREITSGTFQAYADVVFSHHSMPVNVFLQQCRGDGTACGFVGTHGSRTLTGHQFLSSSIVTGAHGHSYRAVVYAGGANQWRTISPFIAYS
jgi:hypothetical protein